MLVTLVEKGYVLGAAAVEHAKALDERTRLSATVKGTAADLNEKYR